MDRASLDRLRDSVLNSERFITPTLGQSPDEYDPLIPFDFCRFEMTNALSCGSYTQAVQIWSNTGDPNTGFTDDSDGIYITVYDSRQQFSKMQTTDGDVGAMGWALKPHDHPEWEIVTMQNPGDFWGTLQSNLAQSAASVSVQAVSSGVLGGYNVFGVNHGATITVYNPVGGGVAGRGAYWFSGATGDRVLCHWDVRQAKYWIVAAEPNNYGYTDQIVLTDVAVSVDPVTHATTVTQTRRTIQLPPWTTISDPDA